MALPLVLSNLGSFINQNGNTVDVSGAADTDIDTDNGSEFLIAAVVSVLLLFGVVFFLTKIT